MAYLTCPSCNRPYLRIGQLINPPRLIYVHREVGKRDPETKEKKPVDYCMGRTAKRVGKNITVKVDKAELEDVISATGCDHIDTETISNHPIPEGGALGDKTMAFTGFSKAKLNEQFPSTFGRGSGKPAVALAGNGQITFNVEASKVFEGCEVIQPAWDAEARKLLFKGYEKTPNGKEDSVWDIRRGKDSEKDKSKSKIVSLAKASTLLKAIGYDFKAAGNQTFEVEISAKNKNTINVVIPEKTPAKKPSRPRKTKAEKAAAAAAAPAPVVNGAAPAATEDEPIIEE